MSAAGLSPSDDRGFTLIELLVAIALTGLLLAGVGGLLIAGIGAQRDVSSSTAATGQAQVLSRSLVQGVRNASWLSAEAAGASGQLLRARVAAVDAAGGSDWRCVAWFWSADAAAVYTTASTTGPVPAPVGATPAGWTVLASGATLPAGTSAPFTVASNQLTVDLLVADPDGKSVRVATSAASRPQNSGGPTC